MFKRALAAVLALTLSVAGLFAGTVPAYAQTGEQDYQAAVRVLSKYKLVQGDERGFRFNDPITRAEVAKILVAALGEQNQVPDYLGRQDFTDTKGHWAEGQIALVRELGYMKGYDQGDFRPQSPVTYAEAVTVLARLAGLQASNAPWPMTYVAPAQEAGIFTADMGLSNRLNQRATRGDVFLLLKSTLVDVKNNNGENLLKLYLDQTPPNVTLDQLPTETKYSVYTLTGNGDDAATITVNGVTTQPNQDGTFQVDVPLKLGTNTLKIKAIDYAGNTKESTQQITRVAASASSLELTGPTQAAVGQSVQLTLTVHDQNGNIDQERSNLDISVTPNMGTFDPRTGLFKAGSKVGTATVTVTSGAAQTSTTIEIRASALARIGVSPIEIALAPGETVVFVAKGFDAYGNEVPFTGGVTWSATGGAVDLLGQFTAGTNTGDVAVTARSDGRAASATVHPLNYQVASVQVTAPTRPMTASGRSQTLLTATLLDVAGRPVTDYRGTLTVTSTAPGTASPVISTVSVIGGVAQIPVQSGTTPGLAQVRVTTNLGKVGAATVTVQPQQVQTVRLTGTATANRADGTVVGAVDAVALDQDGYPMLSPLPQSLVLGLTIDGDPGALFTSNGKTTANIALQEVDGTGSVHKQTLLSYPSISSAFLISGTVKGTGLSYVQVLSGSIGGNQVGVAQQLRVDPIVETVAGALTRIYVNVVDSDGFRVAQPAALLGYNVVLRDGAGAQVAAGKLVGNGPDVGRTYFDVAPKTAGAALYTATLQPGGYTTTVRVPVVAGALDHVAFTATPTAVRASTPGQVVLQAELQDSYNNRITAGSYPITFTRWGVTSGVTQPAIWIVQTISSVGGLASLNVTTGSLVGTDTFQVSVGDPLTPGNPPIVSILVPTTTITTLGDPFRLTLSFGDNNVDGVVGGPTDNQALIGSPLAVKVAVVDQLQGNVISSDSGRTVSLIARNKVTGIEQSFKQTVTNGQAVFNIVLPQVGTYGLRAEATGLQSAFTQLFSGNLSDAQIQPRQGATPVLTADLDTLLADNGSSYAWMQVHLEDQTGKVTTNQTGEPIRVALDTQEPVFANGYFKADDGSAIRTRLVTISPGASTSESIKFYSGTIPIVVTLKATMPNGSNSFANVTTVAPDNVATRLTADTIATETVDSWATADSVITGQTVTVRALNAAGTQATGNTGFLGVQVPADARIVAYYNQDLRAWVSFDSVPRDGVGEYRTAEFVPLYRGEAKFRVRSNMPGVKAYTGMLGALTISAPGQFLGLAPDHLVVNPDYPTVAGGGSQVTVRVTVIDANGNPMPYVTGPIQFTQVTTSPSGAHLVTTVAELIDGVATVQFQSGPGMVFLAEKIFISARSLGLRRSDGTLLDVKITSITVDG